jgi:hypothetical protein
MLRKVISGGQTGADQGGLIAAGRCSLLTGGTMPKGFLTQDGPNPDLAERFGLQEHKSPTYPPRTFKNVADADATVRIAVDFNTAGEKLTLHAIKRLEKKYYDVLIIPGRKFNRAEVRAFTEWLVANGVVTLNVAGNSNKRWSGMQSWSADFLTDVFDTYNKLVGN